MKLIFDSKVPKREETDENLKIEKKNPRTRTGKKKGKMRRTQKRRDVEEALD